jgi:hypothetical protein
VVGAGSASLVPGSRRGGARYNVYRLLPRDDGWEVELSVRAYAAASGRFLPEGDPRPLRAPAAAARR